MRRRYIITPHATTQMRRRGLDESTIRAILAAPEQRLLVRPGRAVLQSLRRMGPERTMYLVRVFVDFDRRPPEAVTAYRTSQVARYWRPAS